MKYRIIAKLKDGWEKFNGYKHPPIRLDIVVIVSDENLFIEALFAREMQQLFGIEKGRYWTPLYTLTSHITK
jgi:hypothetical protein